MRSTLTAAAGLLAVLSAATSAGAVKIDYWTCDYSREGMNKNRGHAHDDYAMVIHVSGVPEGHHVTFAKGGDGGDDPIPAGECHESTPSGLSAPAIVGKDYTVGSGGEGKIRVKVNSCDEVDGHYVAYFSPFKNSGTCEVSEVIRVGTVKGISMIVQVHGIAEGKDHMSSQRYEKFLAKAAYQHFDDDLRHDLRAAPLGRHPGQFKEWITLDTWEVDRVDDSGEKGHFVHFLVPHVGDFDDAVKLLRNSRNFFDDLDDKKGLNRRESGIMKSRVENDYLEKIGGRDYHKASISLVDSGIWRASAPCGLPYNDFIRGELKVQFCDKEDAGPLKDNIIVKLPFTAAGAVVPIGELMEQMRTVFYFAKSEEIDEFMAEATDIFVESDGADTMNAALFCVPDAPVPTALILVACGNAEQCASFKGRNFTDDDTDWPTDGVAPIGLFTHTGPAVSYPDQNCAFDDGSYPDTLFAEVFGDIGTTVSSDYERSAVGCGRGDGGYDYNLCDLLGYVIPPSYW